MEASLSRAYAALMLSVAFADAAPIQAVAPLNVSIKRPDLRPLPGVTLQVTGIVNLQSVTDENGNAEFADLPQAGITITPSRSGFRFEPAQLSIPDLANSTAPAFVAFPTATDLAVSITSDDATPLVGGYANSVITLRNLGTEAATDIAVGFSSLPGLALENVQATQGQINFQTYQTLWSISQLDPGASAEVHTRLRATLPEANVVTVALIEGMDQRDIMPLNNSGELITTPRAATARISLAMAIDLAPARVGETIPLQLTLRNDGPNDATQVAVRTYLPPGASLTVPNDGLSSTALVIPRLAPGAQLQLRGTMRVRLTGTYTVIANVTYLEQQLPTGAAWPEARANFTVQQAFSRISLLAFSDPPNPRVGEDVTVFYVAKNEGPDAVTNLKLFTREDWRLGASFGGSANQTTPPVPGPFAFGEVLPVGFYTYLPFRYTVKAAGDLTNYFTVESQDQLIPNAQDHPELLIPIKTLPADVGLSLDANPKEITARTGEPVTLELGVHNDGPQPARGLLAGYESPGVYNAELDEVIHADRVVRTQVGGYIDILEANETVTVRKHLIASTPGTYTNAAQITLSNGRPDLLSPIATKNIVLRVLPGPPPNLDIAVSVDKSPVNVGEYAIFIVTVTNHAAQPAFNVWVRETDASDLDYAFETVRSYGPGGDDRFSSASERLISRIDPGASYSMSRTMRVRKPILIPYVAKITSVNGVSEANLPSWVATTETSGVQVTSDIAPVAVADRINVKNGDLVNFLIKEPNASAHLASHAGMFGGVGPGFQMLNNDLGSYGYFFDWFRPKNSQSGGGSLGEWIEIGSQETAYTFFSAYTVAAGQLGMSAQLSQLDQLDGNAANDFTQVQINSAPASARISVRQRSLWPTANVGDIVPFVTEIRNEGPDRVTGLTLMETISANLELSYSAAVIGGSGNVSTSFLDPLVRLPALEPGQNFIWQRTYAARATGQASRHVQVARFDQTSLAALPESEVAVTVQPAQADLQLEFIEAPIHAQMTVPALVGVRVRNLGPAVATRVKVSVAADGASLSGFGYGPRAGLDILSPDTFQTQLLPGESATVGLYLTPFREGSVAVSAQVQQSDQLDPSEANNALALNLSASAAPPIPPVLQVRKVRTDFFDHTPIAEIEIDQFLLDRIAPFTVFSLEASSNLRDWEFLKYVGLMPLAPVTFTDHVSPGVTARTYRLVR